MPQKVEGVMQKLRLREAKCPGDSGLSAKVK
jgi:hypothetical protein